MSVKQFRRFVSHAMLQKMPYHCGHSPAKPTIFPPLHSYEATNRKSQPQQRTCTFQALDAKALPALFTCILGRFHDLYTTYVRNGPLSVSWRDWRVSPPLRSFLQPWIPQKKRSVATEGKQDQANQYRKGQFRRSTVQDSTACNQETLVLLDQGGFKERWSMWVGCREENHHKVVSILWVTVSKNRIVPPFSRIMRDPELKRHWLVVREQAFKCAACVLQHSASCCIWSRKSQG